MEDSAFYSSDGEFMIVPQERILFIILLFLKFYTFFPFFLLLFSNKRVRIRKEHSEFRQN